MDSWLNQFDERDAIDGLADVGAIDGLSQSPGGVGGGGGGGAIDEGSAFGKLFTGGASPLRYFSEDIPPNEELHNYYIVYLNGSLIGVVPRGKGPERRL